MYTSSSKSAWDKDIKKEPLYAALSDPKFLTANLTPGTENEFFDSGKSHVSQIFDKIHQHVDNNFKPRKALDFGCGPGRLVVALTHICDNVCGVDLNPYMIEHAKAYSKKYGAYVPDFHLTDNLMNGLDERYDFIHSVLVFQHIPTASGMAALKSLLDHLAPGGCGAMQFIIHRNASFLRNSVNRLRIFSPVNIAVNLLKKQPFNTAFVQMNAYNLNDIINVMSHHGIKNIRIETSQWHDCSSATLLFKREEER